MEEQPVVNNTIQQSSVKPVISKLNHRIIVGIVLALLVVIGGAYILTKWLQKEMSVSLSQNSNIDSITRWQVYRNEKFGFEVKFPRNWSATTGGIGEDVIASGKESSIFIEEEQGIRGVSISVVAFGSDKLGSLNSSATNLKEYTDLLQKTNDEGKVIRRSVGVRKIADIQALEHEVLNWDVDNHREMWKSEIYLQKNNNFYQFRLVGNVSEPLFNQILSTFKFTN